MTTETEEGLVIDSTNFAEYFFDVRQNSPQPGQVMAKFTAVAIFGEGREKWDIIKLLLKDKVEAATQVMNRLHLAKPPDHIKVCKDMAYDMLNGVTPMEVSKKDYEYVLQAVYYTQKEYVPTNDPNWETLQVLDFDPETNTFNARIEI